ncbi:hypothetical protein L7F22_058292 [Adiantum nelumboides]|nr:hypothetical protein [Adiantum nelumboides]
MVDCSNMDSSWNSLSTSSDTLPIASITVVDTTRQAKGGTSDWNCILREVCQERPPNSTVSPTAKQSTSKNTDLYNRKPCMSGLGIYMCDCEEDSTYCNLVTRVLPLSEKNKTTIDRAQERGVPEEMEINDDGKNCWHALRKKEGKFQDARIETRSSDKERASGNEFGNTSAIAAMVSDSPCRGSKLAKGFVQTPSLMKGSGSVCTKGRVPTIASHLELTESATSQSKICSNHEEDKDLAQPSAPGQNCSVVASTLRTQLAGLKLDVGSPSVLEPAPYGTLHGVLHCTLKDGLPNYTFLLDDYDEVLSAKIWVEDMKVGRQHEMWKYSFYTLREERKRKGKPGWKNWRRKDKLHATLVGKMKVSSVLCIEEKNKVLVKSKCILFSPRLNELAVVEEGKNSSQALLSLPDTRVRYCSNTDTNLCSLSGTATGSTSSMSLSPAGVTALWKSSSPAKFVEVETAHKSRQMTDNCRGDSTIEGTAFPDCLFTSSPQHAELAAMLIDVPLQRQDRRVPITDQRLEAGITVILPSGNHGRPLCDLKGPSPLIRRWKEGGKCDCKGWDLGCGLVVLGNWKKAKIKGISESSESQGAGQSRPLRLYKQDTDQEEVFFSLAPQSNGLLGLEFRAPLSPLQAFAIAVATLHGRETRVSQRPDSVCSHSTEVSQGISKDDDGWPVTKGNMKKLFTTQAVNSKHPQMWQPQIAINNSFVKVHASEPALSFERV